MIRLMKHTFYKEKETKEALNTFILSADRLSMSEQCSLFEQKFSKWQNRNFVSFVANGSAANLILIQALLNLGRIKPGDRVGFSAVTWPTNVMPIIQLGLTPVAIDCELDTLNISKQKLQEVHSNSPIKALFITNALGFCHDLQNISDYCGEQNIILLEDNCESLGSVHNNKKLGNFGLASTFSTFVGHHMSTIEGGMVCTDDEELYQHITMCRAHGWDRNLASEIQLGLRNKVAVSDFYANYTFYELAYNVRPTEIQGFLGVNQLNYLDEIITKRQENFLRFKQACSSPDILTLNTEYLNVISNFAMPIICKNKEVHHNLIQRFLDLGIEIRPIIAGNMQRQPFYNKHVLSHVALPNADHIHDCGFYFGNNPDLTEDEIKTIITALQTL